MRKLSVTLGLVIGIFSIASLTTTAQARRNMVCVYENNNYGGWEQCFTPGEQIGDLGTGRMFKVSTRPAVGRSAPSAIGIASGVARPSSRRAGR